MFMFVKLLIQCLKYNCFFSAFRVWIKMLNYNGYIQGDTQPQHAGSTAMMLRHLKSENNAVIVYVSKVNWK